MERLIQLDNLNMQEALRYLGSGGQTPDDAFMALMKTVKNGACTGKTALRLPHF